MEFEWDERKNRANVEKHGIRFERAQLIFRARVVSLIDDRHEYGEERLIAIGVADPGEILSVVYTERNGRRRIISARPALRGERQIYEQETHS